eukprot:Rhum_TRINITY_DN15442_c17_g1::Rhum_TRINITY_DN15442_c17_g1_i1::g.157639::m.157639
MQHAALPSADADSGEWFVELPPASLSDDDCEDVDADMPMPVETTAPDDPPDAEEEDVDAEEPTPDEAHLWWEVKALPATTGNRAEYAACELILDFLLRMPTAWIPTEKI